MMLVVLIINDSINATIERRDLLMKEDRIHFNDIVNKSNKTSYPLNIDSLHYVVFGQSNSHENREAMLKDVDSIISVYADKMQILQ
jgi:hypothetical protein